MKKELRIFFTALMFYTRIRVPKGVDHSPDFINKASRYFPLVGWIVGLVSLGGFFIGYYLITVHIGVVFSLIAGVLTTGAFHEDGLADVFDGFGGGWTKERILAIMKDSQIGAFGAISLVLLFLLKYTALSTLALRLEGKWLLLVVLFTSYHSLARLTAINIVFTSEYARDDATSKVKPVARLYTTAEVSGAFFWGLTPLLGLCTFHYQFALVLIPLFLLAFFARRYFYKWIDGYTGDCLGAVEQMAEVLTLLSFIAIWKFI